MRALQRLRVVLMPAGQANLLKATEAGAGLLVDRALGIAQKAALKFNETGGLSTCSRVRTRSRKATPIRRKWKH